MTCRIYKLSSQAHWKFPLSSLSTHTHSRTRCISSTKTIQLKQNKKDEEKNDTLWSKAKVNAYVGHSFPDFIEGWNRTLYRKVGYGLAASSSVLTGCMVAFTNNDLFALSWDLVPVTFLWVCTGSYWYVGEKDVRQNQHAVRRNYPVIGNMRYVLETIRPELRQYIVESDLDGRPFDRLHRAQVYQRAKNVDDTLAFGTRKDLSEINSEWACHSMWPKVVNVEKARHTIGAVEYGTTKPYSSSIFNISAMSYGAISDNAILALNAGAKIGGFSHNTGEGGVSKFHQENGGDLVWNIGTGYFGCGSGDTRRVFEPALFQETLGECQGQVKMVEIKMSQGAKPGHGGLLPKSKISKEIAQARKLPFPPISDCHSPSYHSAFSSHVELIEFITKLRELSGGIPIGLKMCVGQPRDFAALCKAIHEIGMGPDFITIDGAEGGTGAAPPEFSNSLGLPLEEGLILARNMLVGSNLKDKISLIASGKITTGFSITRNLALGADVTNSARGFMLSLGCIQALKCNTNNCPTGIATQKKELMYGLDPSVKQNRVYNFHNKTVLAACEIIGSMGHVSTSDVLSADIMRRVETNVVRTLNEQYPELEPSCLINCSGPQRIQSIWDSLTDDQTSPAGKRWIY